MIPLSGINFHLLLLSIILFFIVFILWLTPKVGFMKKMGPYAWVVLGTIALTNLNILPKKSPLYDTIFEIGAPVAFCLMLLRVNFKKFIKSISWRAFMILLCAVLGSFAGGMVSAFLFGRGDPNLIKAIAGKTAAWIGGPENWVAVAVNIFHLDENYFGASYAAGLVPYMAWVALIFSLAGTPFVSAFNRWVRPKYPSAESSTNVAEEDEHELANRKPVGHEHILLMAAIAIGVVALSKGIDQLVGGLSIPLPFEKTTELPIPWILLATTIMLVLTSYTKTAVIPATYEIGLALLYFSITTYLAKSDLVAASKLAGTVLPPFLVILVVHALFVGIGAKIFRVDWLTAALASICTIGGVVTGPMCALIYGAPHMVPLAIIFAGLGVAFANYLGWVIGVTFL
ncbi:MAG: DUF819 family protein [Deltaproteobacteria bacterium]|nr:DUF819 family protein [Deltaproteobacteria bacterium]